jgi:hypothetical protein
LIDFLLSNLLQPKNTDNFFSTTNKENIVKKKSINNLKKDKYNTLFVDNDNNHQVIGNINFNISNYVVKNRSEEQKNYKKKLDRSLSCFDPLNSGNNL